MTAGISARTPQHALAALLDLHRPKRLLLVGASQFPALDAFKAAHPDTEVFGGQPEHAFVTFTARWHDATGEHSHREQSSFVQNEGRWYFIDPTVEVKAGRNDACLCGSGQKFKKCCHNYLQDHR